MHGSGSPTRGVYTVVSTLRIALHLRVMISLVSACRAAKEAIPKLKELCWPCDQINAYVPLVVEPIQYLHGSPYGGVVARDLPNAIVSMANGGRGQRQIIPRFAQSGTVQHDVAKRWRAQSLRQGEELRDLKELQREELMNFLSQHKLTRE